MEDVKELAKFIRLLWKQEIVSILVLMEDVKEPATFVEYSRSMMKFQSLF